MTGNGANAAGKRGGPAVRRPIGMSGLVIVMVLGVLVQAALVGQAAAQQVKAGATLTSVVGRVETLRAGQAQWAPAVVGVQLAEGDEIRAFAGASAELVLPDKSHVVLIENSRLVLSKLEFDQQQQSRLVLLHLAVGKLRAAISQAGITLVRARQSNFAISTPTAVAAARGTIVWVYTDGQQNLMAVEPEPGVRIPSRIECITLGGSQRTTRRQQVLAGSLTADCGPPVPTPVQFQTLINPFNANLTGNVNAPSTVSITALITAQPGTTPPTFPTSSTPIGLPGPPSFGNNQEVFAQPPPTCVSTIDSPCP
jgi:hypothetical protein